MLFQYKAIHRLIGSPQTLKNLSKEKSANYTTALQVKIEGKKGGHSMKKLI